MFIGNNAAIMPGVTIGNNVIIGYGSIVTKDVPSDEIWAGIPARRIESLEEYYEKNKKNLVYTNDNAGNSLKGLSKENFLRNYFNIGSSH